MASAEHIKSFIRIAGPVLPIQIAKEIQSNTIIASAYLSELVSKKELKVSSVKVGGSPLYYLPGQEHLLQRFSNHLGEKEKKVYGLLQKDKVLMEREQDPLVRVILKSLKDFAVQLQVNHGNNSDIFWRWYLSTNEEAEQIIRSKLGETIIEEERKETKNIQHTEEKKEAEQKQEETKIKPISTEPEKKEIERESTEAIETRKKQIIEEQKKLKEERTEAKKESTKQADDFLAILNRFFSKNNISIVEQLSARKGSEAEFIIMLPSAVGNLTYYCKAKSKQRINEGDLSAAYIAGQSKKLPILFITKGELTKKAKEMLENEFKGMAVKQV